MSWNTLIEKVEKYEAKSATKSSYKFWLPKIFKKAQEWGIPSGYAEEAGWCNLCDAVPEMRRAIRWEDKDMLARIFEEAATLRNRDLRLALHIPELEDVVVERNKGQYRITLNKEQYERVKTNTMLKYRYKECYMPDIDMEHVQEYQ